ncbi:MAG: hypothetical protein R2911_15535 [Caldilineaceae bacterium]
MTYSNQSTQVRILPYHDMILIGVPFAARADMASAAPPQAIPAGDATPDTEAPAQPVSADYLALPHEVGHLLFRYGYAPGGAGQIHTYLEEMLFAGDWRLTWLEEIFADAYGCLTAGPISVLGFQELLADGLPASDHADLDEHPFASIRPLMQTELVRTLAAHRAAAAIVNGPAAVAAAGQSTMRQVADRIMAESQRVQNELTTHKIVMAMMAASGNGASAAAGRAHAQHLLPPSHEVAVRTVVERILREHWLNDAELAIYRIASVVTSSHSAPEQAAAAITIAELALELFNRAGDAAIAFNAPPAARQMAQEQLANLNAASGTPSAPLPAIDWTMVDSTVPAPPELIDFMLRELGRAWAATAAPALSYGEQRELRQAAGNMAKLEWENPDSAFWTELYPRAGFVDASGEPMPAASSRAGVANREAAMQSHLRRFAENIVLDLLTHANAARLMAQQIFTESAQVVGQFSARERAARAIVEEILANASIPDAEIAERIRREGERSESTRTVQFIVARILAAQTANDPQMTQAEIARRAQDIVALVAQDLQLADQLDAHWRDLLPRVWPKWVEQQWLGAFATVDDPLRSKTYQIRGVRVSGFELIRALQPVFNAIVELLSPLFATRTAWTTAPAGADSAAAHTMLSIDDLHKQYIAFAEEQILKATLPTLAQIQQALAEAATMGMGDGMGNPYDPMLGDPTLGDPPVDDPTLHDPALHDPMLGDPPLYDPALDDSTLPNPRQPGRPQMAQGQVEIERAVAARASAAVGDPPLATLEAAVGEAPYTPSRLPNHKFAWLTRHLIRLEEGVTLDTLAQIVLFMGWSFEGPTKHGP